MLTKRELLDELARRLDIAQGRGDWRAVELYTATWHRVHAEPESSPYWLTAEQVGVATLAVADAVDAGRRARARGAVARARAAAAQLARIPLDERLTGVRGPSAAD